MAVRSRLLNVLAAMAAHTRMADDCEVLARQAEMIRKASHEVIQHEIDLQDIEERCQRVRRAFPIFAKRDPRLNS